MAETSLCLTSGITHATSQARQRWGKGFIHTSDPVMLFCKHILGKLFVHVQFELTTNLLKTCNQGFHERGQCVDIQEIQPLS